MADESLGEVMAVFLGREGRGERLLAEHADDGTGHCRACSAGPQGGRHRYPCRLAAYASQSVPQVTDPLALAEPDDGAGGPPYLMADQLRERRAVRTVERSRTGRRRVRRPT